jgi:hypothetical protein
MQSSTAVVSSSVKITDGKIGGAEGGLGTAQLYNVEFGAGFTGVFKMNGTDVSSFGTAAVGGAGTPGAGSSIAQCPGYNPVGVSSATHLVGASPYTYTAGLAATTLYASTTGLISSCTVGGFNILPAATAGVVTLNLAAVESAVFTYTGTLTLVASVL